VKSRNDAEFSLELEKDSDIRFFLNFDQYPEVGMDDSKADLAYF
jgi:hypothetical protein